MSTRVGAGSKRQGPPRHQNTHTWKFDKNKTDPKTKIVQNVVVTNCCEKCTGVIEWKRKYGKYKPLTQPAKCVRCNEKRIKFAYHQYCGPCVQEIGGCAKCGQKEVEVINKPQQSAAESAKLEAEFQKEIKLLPERKRRTFLRYLAKQEKSLTSNKKSNDVEAEDETEEQVDEKPVTIQDVHRDAFAKLKGLTEKYGKTEADDLEDFDLEDLEDFDLSDSCSDEDDE